jgi:hypothetical protein
MSILKYISISLLPYHLRKSFTDNERRRFIYVILSALRTGTPLLSNGEFFPAEANPYLNNQSS